MEILPVLYLAAAVLLLLTAIIRFKVHPFLALLVTGLFFGLITGMPVDKVLESLLDGFAGTLRWIGIVIVLGALIGEILNETGGSFKIASSILRVVGEKRIPLTMGITGYVISIPVFADVAYIMFQPITANRATNILIRITLPKFAPTIPAAARGPGVGGIRACVAVNPAVNESPTTSIVRLLFTVSASVIG